MAAISKKARLLSESQSDEPVDLNLLIRKGLNRSGAETLVQEIRELVGASEDVKLLPAMGMVLCHAPARSIRALAELDDVEWIDVESTASIEELMDG